MLICREGDKERKKGYIERGKGEKGKKVHKVSSEMGKKVRNG